MLLMTWLDEINFTVEAGNLFMIILFNFVCCTCLFLEENPALEIRREEKAELLDTDGINIMQNSLIVLYTNVADIIGVTPGGTKWRCNGLNQRAYTRGSIALKPRVYTTCSIQQKLRQM